MKSSDCHPSAHDTGQSAPSYIVTVKYEPAMVKEEPEWGECDVSAAAAAEGLYAGHEGKDELVVGPELTQQQDVAFSAQKSTAHIRDMKSSDCHPSAHDTGQSAPSYIVTVKYEPAMVKEEPEWGECDVSAAAAAEGLYAGHEVKDELVVGPELTQQQDIAFSAQRNNPIAGMYNLARIVRELGTREQCVQFACDNGLIPASKECRVHRIPMRIDYRQNKTVGYFVCNKGTCRARLKVARGKGTWFENVRITMPRVFFLMYAFVHRWSYELAIFEDPERSPEGCLSKATVADWYNYCRETVVIYELNRQEVNGKIGGPGKVVQIDESKFGKRKYNKGCHIEGHWVLGLIEDGSEDLRLEVCPNNVHSAEVLVPLIEKHVAVGSIIHTDYWQAYDCLESHGFTLKKVNHSDPDKPFVAPDGTHTQRIESQWRVVKRFFKNDNCNHKNNFTDVIVEYLWRRSVQRNKKDIFMELITAIKHVYNK